MLTASHPPSTFARMPSSSLNRPPTKDSEKQAIWVPMLNSASKGKDLPEKQLIVLGGTPTQQREFLETLGPSPDAKLRYGHNDRRRNNNSSKTTPPMSNKYALGYTYQDVLDADQEDTLARLNVYLLASSSAEFAPLLRPVLSKRTVPDTLVTILLDWADPFRWPRVLRQWVRLLRQVVLSLDEETKLEMEETMAAWRERRVGPDKPVSMPGAGAGVGMEQKTVVPLGPGEWDEGLGIPLSIVCINAEKMERLERDYGWQEEQFDFLMQWLRTVLLKHGASLVYTTNYEPNHVRTLIHSSLGIHSLLKRETARHNVIDREKILVPPNWDSWGKIRILKEGFDPEKVGAAWGVEIQEMPGAEAESGDTAKDAEAEDSSAVAMFEAVLSDPANSRSSTYKPATDIDAAVTVPDTQAFLAQQATLLEQLRAEDEKAGRRARKGAPAPTGAGTEIDDGSGGKAMNPRVAEQIGPYQINVNGIDFDAEEAMRKIREREAERVRVGSGSGVSTPRRGERGVVSDGGDTGGGVGAKTPGNELMSTFFNELIKKKEKGRGVGGASGSGSPTRGGQGVEKRGITEG